MSFVVPDDAVLVADGGLATELEARGNDLSDSEAFAVAAGAPEVVAVGVNCCAPTGAAGSGPLTSPRSPRRLPA